MRNLSRSPCLRAALLALALCLDVSSAVGQEPAPVRVVTVERAPLARELRLTATVTSERDAALSPRVSGLVHAIHVDAGSRVAAGKVLLELDPALARLALQRAEAALKEARAQLAEADRLHTEAREMVERRLVPVTRLHAAEAEKRVATAAVERLAAEQRQQAEIVARHTVVAPFPGVISRRLTEVGEWVETGTPVLELVDTRRLRIDVQVPQERYHDIAVGSQASVELDALPGKVLKGRIAARVPVKNPEARTFLARVEVPGGEKLMTPGMSAQVVFALKSPQAALSVPRDALVRRPDGTTTVWVVGTGEVPTVSERRVEIGRSLRDTIEVRSGLSAGARVVVRGNETLKEGQRVRILQAAGG